MQREGFLFSSVRRIGTPMSVLRQVMSAGVMLALFSMPLQGVEPLQAPPADPASDTTKKAGADDKDRELQLRIRELIEELGAPSYSSRVRARKELEGYGLLAFDGLREAQSHPNSEISATARFLLGSLRVLWASDTDSPDVRDLLQDYGFQEPNERKTRLQMLANRPLDESLSALVRIARFETDLRLGREAALLVLAHADHAKLSEPKRQASLIREVIGGNTSPASDWLRALADELDSGQVDIARWQGLIRDEEQRLKSGAGRDVDAPTLFRLYQSTAERLAGRGENAAAAGLARQAMKIVPDRLQNLQDAVQWASKNKFWDSVLVLAETRDVVFNRNALLMYMQAEALGETGNAASSEALGLKALEMNPIDDFSAQLEIGPVDEATSLAIDEHLRRADYLKRADKLAWAEREWTYVISRTPVWVLKSVEARIGLSTMLQEHERYAETVKVLEPLVERIRQDGAFNQNLLRERTQFMPSEIAPRMEYCRGLALQATDPEGAKAAYRKIFFGTPPDLLIGPVETDALIAMFKFKSDPAWDAEVKERVKRAVDRLEKEITTWEHRGPDQDLVSQYYNLYAWMVSNTEGNFELALRRAKMAAEMNPDAAVLDTLARCLFVNGKIEEAIEKEKQALALEPGSVPMLRQLREFEDAKAAASNPKS